MFYFSKADRPAYYAIYHICPAAFWQESILNKVLKNKGLFVSCRYQLFLNLSKKWWLAWWSQFNLHSPYKLVASFPQRDHRVCYQNLLEKQRWFIYSIITADFNIVQHISCRCTNEFSQTVSQKQHAMNLSFEYTNVRKKYSDNKVDFPPSPPKGLLE